MFIVFDLDGTLCDVTHRLHFIDRNRKEGPDWRAFFAECHDDKPIFHMIESLRSCRDQGHKIEIWSGRSDEVRGMTETWLADHNICETLIMRKAGDKRPDDLVKREWVDQRGRPDLIIDDRSRVVKMWRELGLTCIQIAPGDF